MVGCEKRETAAVGEGVFDFQVIVVIDVVEMEKRENARISSLAGEIFAQIGAAKMFFQQFRG